MSRKIIDVGSANLAGDGEPLRDALIKVNDNFEEIYNAIDDIEVPDVSEFITAADIPAIPSDISELSDAENLLGQGGGIVQPYLELTHNPFIVQPIELDEAVEFTKLDSEEAVDTIDTGISLTRDNQGGLYNPEAEQSFNSDVSPNGTLWNSSGWGDLSDYDTREYVVFTEALNNRIGELILDAELIMWDTVNDKYYTFDFSSWTQGGAGGGFAYTRRQLIDPNIFIKTDGGSETDVLVADDPEGTGIAITRGNNQGIFNLFRESNWNQEVSPAGTLWNANGWNNLADVESRTYINFYNAIGRNLGNNVLNRELVMYIPDTDEYYAIKFLSWTQDNAGGGFKYLRYKLDLDQLPEGISFSDGSVQRTAYVKTNILSTALNKRRIETQDGFVRVELTELVVGDTLETTVYTSASDTNFIIVNETQELFDIYNTVGFIDLQISLDEETWINGRITGFSSLPVRRYTFSLDETVTVTEGQTVYYRTRSGAEPVRWFRAQGDNFRGAIIDFHAYSVESGTIVGTIHIIRDSGEGNITFTDVRSGSSSIEDLNLYFRSSNESERNISAVRSDGRSDTVSIHWHGKFFYGTEYRD
jgi:hypothetical protein